MLTVNLETARRVVEGVEAKAKSLGCSMNIAVVDAGGNLVAHGRMDNARIGAIDIAINKAWSARAFDMETAELGRYSQPGGPFFGIHASNGGRVMLLAGGVPLRRADRIIGALGVSGGSEEDDSGGAQAGVDAMMSEGLGLSFSVKLDGSECR
ncbi:MAG TPA: heme-binding protein [Alphaproteobacteria bacterium]